MWEPTGCKNSRPRRYKRVTENQCRTNKIDCNNNSKGSEETFCDVESLYWKPDELAQLSQNWTKWKGKNTKKKTEYGIQLGIFRIA